MYINQKGVVAQFILVIFLFVAIGAGLYLSGKTTIFKPRADSGPQLYGGVCKFSPEEVELGEKCAPNPFLNDKDPGYKSVTITCADGFKQTIDDGCISNTKGVVDGKSTPSGVDLMAAQICRNHSSCPNLNNLGDPHTQAYPTITADVFGEYGTIDFMVIAKQGLDTLHTAVWDNATSEEMAKKDGRQGRYVGYSTSLAQRHVSFPAYVEYFAIDKNGNRENINKRLLTKNPHSISIVKNIIGGDKEYIINNAPILLDDNSPSFNYQNVDDAKNTVEFRYLLPGDHELKYIVPSGYKVTMETCVEGNCVKNSQQSDTAKITSYQTMNLKLQDKPGSSLQLILTYDQPGESDSVVTKPIITEAKVECDYSNPLNASLFFPAEKENVSHYAVRVNNKNNAWNGSCDKPNADDQCFNYPLNGSNNIFSTTVKLGEPYQIWYHKIYSNGNLGPLVKSIDFVCVKDSGKVPPATSIRPSTEFKAVCSSGKVFFTWYGTDSVKIRGAKNPQDFTATRSSDWWNSRNHEALGDIALNIPISETEPDRSSPNLTHYTYDGEGSIKSGDKFDFWIHNVSSDGKTSEATYASQLVTCE